ncbi:MAG: PLP-dependent transferase [Actinomycetaceae bacterium]|nr:PLP-dependent transferase [Actinomycetaceae bacterium]
MTAEREELRLETIIAHVGAVTDKVTGALTTPITMSTAYAHPALGQSTGYDYTRTANPTRDVLQDALARLEGGVAGFATSSGMAAVDLLIGTLAPGSRIVTTEDLYGGSYRLLGELSASGAHRVDFVHGEDGLLAALQTPADLVLMETPTNPMMVEVSIPAIAAASRAAGALLAVDNTFYTPVFQQPLAEGADIVLHSATKYLGGHNDVLAGALVTGREDLAQALAARLNTTGATLSPFDSWLLMRGIKTLALRMERHQANARRVAAALEASEHVARVYYTGRGGMISFDPAEHVDMPAILTHVRLFTFAESLGGVESLITCPAVQTHMDVPRERRLAYGLSDTLLRLSVGLEHPDDLVADLLGALEAAAIRQ